MSCSPRDQALLPPSSAEQGFVTARLGRRNSANLTPASGRQDHTILPSAKASLVRVLLIAHKPFDQSCDPIARKTLPRPPHPAPTSVTIAKRPSVWDGMAKVLEVIWGVRKPKYFCKEDWTASISLIQFNKFLRARNGIVREHIPWCPGRGAACSRRCQRVARMRA